MQKHGGIWLALLLALLAAAVLAPVAAMASEPHSVEINDKNFPDARFQAYVKDFDKDGDGSLSEEIADVKEINVSGQYISNLTGIEHFTALGTLDCSENQLTSLDVSKNTELTYLYCFNNQLTELDVSQNKALKTLDCSDNQLTELDVLRHTELGSLVCSNNQLTSLDVSQNTKLWSLNCSPPDSAAGSEPQRGRNLVGEPRGAGDRVDRQGRKHYEGPEGSLGRSERYRQLERLRGSAHRHLRL